MQRSHTASHYSPLMLMQLAEFTTETPQAVLGRWREIEGGAGMTEGKGRGELMCFYPVGTYSASVCLIPSLEMSAPQQTHTHTPEEQSPLPVFTHSEDWGINSMMKPNTTTAALSADGLGNSSGKRTQTHTHMHAIPLLPSHNLYRQTNHYAQSSEEMD